jgi:uncharacterized glyoxalase superfamily protein PhnB
MSSVKPIPDGYHTVTPHLVVRDAAKAIDVYAKAFGAEERFRMPGPGGVVMHAELAIGDSVVMLGEEAPQMGATSPQTIGGSPVSLLIYVKDVDASFARAERAGCTAQMPPTDMFWGDRCAGVADPFGYLWSFATRQKELTEEEMRRAGEQFAREQAEQHGQTR